MALVIGIIFAIWLLHGSFKVVSAWKVAVVFRLGKVKRIAEPGVLFLMPFIDSLYYVDMRTKTQTISIPEVLTKDTVPIEVDAIVFWKVTDAHAAVLGIQDFKGSIELAAQVALRDVIGSSDLATVLSNRGLIDSMIETAIAPKAEAWGIVVQSVEIKDVSLPEALQNAMSQGAQAQREAQARSLLAESEISIAKQFVEAAKVYESDPVALRLRAMNLAYEAIKSGQTNTIVLPASGLDGLASLAPALSAVAAAPLPD